MSNPFLLLWLEAPMQSWGYDSRFGRRDSLEFPTKSGVLGLLCCARGAGGEESDWLAQWADLDMQIACYVPRGCDEKAQTRQPLLRDFHMVGSGYDDQDPWQNLLIPKTSDGKKAVGGGTKMTYRHYLQDVSFAVALETPKSLADEVVTALENPVWDVYLGRKNCVPTEFISQGRYDSAKQALEAGEALATKKKKAFSFCVLHGEHEGEVLTLNDVPVQFGQQKKYRDRQVTVQRWKA